jgi:hypothetical protein
VKAGKAAISKLLWAMSLNVIDSNELGWHRLAGPQALRPSPISKSRWYLGGKRGFSPSFASASLTSRGNNPILLMGPGQTAGALFGSARDRAAGQRQTHQTVASLTGRARTSGKSRA